MNNRRVQQGFSLIELMVAVAIVGILTAIALPSYTSYIQRGTRSEARSAMLEAQQFMERYYAANNSYANATLPDRLLSVPATNAKYTLSVVVDTPAGSYTVTATQANGNTDSCGNLTLTGTGAKGRSGSALSVADCWK